MSNQGGNIEQWALTRAHQIVIREGMLLVDAAQSLDHKRTSTNTYALRKAISDCLLEAMMLTRAKSANVEDARL